ncbi:bifunctional tetrahydrofolate synthase/dihydrofolate synthase [Legionella worsleiensis]|uniref:Dihydrofolate synthase/folylpolyglutamate synthase n=1 Tax=Legionella worsleiensis TaxID=45076 RepID=A0A0W1AL69_9GAMM|nr:bifunctional tetrahydrofolate synthase/dihydrofolate synthase [Legionella worsleiensis]KTD82034.1 bifunctional protein FolC [Legionella worsleiensis]STY30298.1 folylpolyglutamate synthase [Legionella worsleiensis]
MHNPLSEWDLNHWLTSLESRYTREIQLGLTRIESVAKKLRLLVSEAKIITVAGTNGKGSTVRALETIYHTAGYKVGAYTSPHLVRFNERIRVNMKSVSDDDLCCAFCAVEEGRGQVELTYFEMTTLAALWHFKRQKLDVLIMEVGLGGRLDATNILDADLAIITTIDYDHQEFLGTTLDAIGYEKAGILRHKKPFVYADEQPPVSILKRADEIGCSGFLYNEHYSYQVHQSHWTHHFSGRVIDQLPVPQIQLKSASAALTASLLLGHELPVVNEHYRLAMKSIFLPGRLQLIKFNNRQILFDVSHNPQAARLLAARIKQMRINGRVHAIFSALKDKDISGLIVPLGDCINIWYPAQLDNKRAASSELLMTEFKNAALNVDFCYTDPVLAFEHALSQSDSDDLIVVYGSFFTVSQVMAAQHHILEQKEIQ